MKKIKTKNEKRGGKEEKRGREPRMGEKTEKERLALAHLGCPEW